jgi:hypothetical protein
MLVRQQLFETIHGKFGKTLPAKLGNVFLPYKLTEVLMQVALIAVQSTTEVLWNPESVRKILSCSVLTHSVRWELRGLRCSITR